MANHVTQVPTEVVYKGTPKVRVTQVPTQVVYAGTPRVRVSQVAVQVIYRNPSVQLRPVQQFILP